MGEILAEPLDREVGILFANAGTDALIRSKMDFDVIGHFNRDDVFQFNVPGQPEIRADKLS